MTSDATVARREPRAPPWDFVGRDVRHPMLIAAGSPLWERILSARRPPTGLHATAHPWRPARPRRALPVPRDRRLRGQRRRDALVPGLHRLPEGRRGRPAHRPHALGRPAPRGRRHAPAVLVGRRVLLVSALAGGVGVGLFIDEIGKFITESNDYFFAPAAPLIYGALLLLAALWLVVRRGRPGRSTMTIQAGVEAIREAVDGRLTAAGRDRVVTRLRRAAATRTRDRGPRRGPGQRCSPRPRSRLASPAPAGRSAAAPRPCWTACCRCGWSGR